MSKTPPASLTMADFAHADLPADLRTMQPDELQAIANSLRQTLIQTLNQCGGHFAGNLGTVELSVALHATYHTPHDRIVWDVGHQAYPHKMLTGRAARLASIKQAGGLAPFPTRDESPYDTFGVGHSSTSISAAVGMALAAEIKGEQRHSVAIIGDGGMTAGMAFEAMNHAGAHDDTDLLVILNDNDMSISPNVGALSNYFSRILSSKLYCSVRSGGKRLFQRLPSIKSLLRRTEVHMKGMLVPGTLFEELGFNYIGPIDGHDLPLLMKTLHNLKDIKEPRLLHVVTKKGKGYAPAEADPVGYHAVKPGFLDKDKLAEEQRDKSTEDESAVAQANSCANDASVSSQTQPSTQHIPTYSEVFGKWLCDMAEADSRLIGITPAMREGSGMVAFSQRFAQRYIDVGIAEQHSVTLAAGLACEGLKPVVAIYSTFLQRAYDQLIHDVCLQNLDVLFALDRAGLVGADGPTHAGSFDLSFLRCVPNMIIMAPSDQNECRAMLTTGYQYPGPAAVRYPRGTARGVLLSETLDQLPIGKSRVLRRGQSGVAICSFGTMLEQAQPAAESLDATLVDMRFIKPLDTDCLKQLAADHQLIVTVEDNAVLAGAGSAVSEALHAMRLTLPVLHCGLPDTFLPHASVSAQQRACGVDADGLIQQIRQVQVEQELSWNNTPS